MNQSIVDLVLPKELFVDIDGEDLSEAGHQLRRLRDKCIRLSMKRCVNATGQLELELPLKYVSTCFKADIRTPETPPPRMTLYALVSETQEDSFQLSEVPIFQGVLSKVITRRQDVDSVTFVYRDPLIAAHVQDRSLEFYQKSLIDIIETVMKESYSKAPVEVRSVSCSDDSATPSPIVKTTSSRGLVDIVFITDLVTSHGFHFYSVPSSENKYTIELTKPDFSKSPKRSLATERIDVLTSETSYGEYLDAFLVKDFTGSGHEEKAQSLPDLGSSYKKRAKVREEGVSMRLIKEKHYPNTDAQTAASYAKAAILNTHWQNQNVDFLSTDLLALGKTHQFSGNQDQETQPKGIYYLSRMQLEIANSNLELRYRGCRP